MSHKSYRPLTTLSFRLQHRLAAALLGGKPPRPAASTPSARSAIAPAWAAGPAATDAVAWCAGILAALLVAWWVPDRAGVSNA
jgi:hypothetical protein